MSDKNDHPSAQPPLKEKGNLKVGEPKESAGGIEAVKHAMKHVIGEVGFIKGTQVMLKVNQYKGFDCPGCAWPDPDKERAIVEFCENGAKAVAEEATKNRVDKKFFQQHSIKELAEWSDYQIGKSGRITSPFIIDEGETHYKPIGWEDAFQLISDELNDLSSPDEAIFYTSGRTSNEAAFLYQLFVRQYGTNNLPDCSNMCHESSGAALSETVGIGKGSVKLEDFYKAEVIMIIGQNPGTNHPRMLSALQKAKKNGAVIITVNPLKEAGLLKFRHPQNPVDIIGKGTSLTDLYLQVRTNMDVPLLLAINKLLIEKGKIGKDIIDQEFIDNNTDGFKEYKAFLDSLSIEDLIEQTGINLAEVETVVDVLASKSKIIVCWAMGLTQHKNAVDNIREIVNLLLLKGSIGKPGAGTCPVRGHSNVQGDRTMGIWEKPPSAFLDSLEAEFNFTPPRKHGYDTVHAIKAMADGKASVFVGLGGNFLSATPDTEFTAKALRNCSLTVQVSTKLNRSHLVHGKRALILPCLGRTEEDVQKGEKQFVSVENSTGVVHQSQGNKKPISGDLKSEPRIIARMAQATLKNNSSVDWVHVTDNYDRIRDLIEKTIDGFNNYNERVRKPGGFYLPNGAREGNYNTQTGKARFTINELPSHKLDDNQYLMMTIRSHDQFNTTLYGLDDRYRGIYNQRRVVLMNQEDMLLEGFTTGDKVNIISNYNDQKRIGEGFKVIAYDIPTKCLATYFPEANVLIPWDLYARKSHTPVSKSFIVELNRV